jgi:hypothetical protein
LEVIALAMFYNYGRAMATPNYPFAGYGFPGAFNPWWNPFWGYGTFPGMGAPFMGYGAPPTFGPPYAPTYIPRSDEEIRDFVLRTIESDPEVPADANINVSVQSGVVTLTGTVPNKRVKHAVGDDAWWVPPVVDVHNELEITPRRERMAEMPTTGGKGR